MSANGVSKVLVTGGAGFVGSHICEHLLREKQQVIVVDVRNAETTSPKEKTANITYLKRLALAAPGAQLSVYYCDIREKSALRQILDREKPTACVHAAALVMDRRSVHTAADFIAHNVCGTQCLLDAITQTGTVEQLVFISSRSAVGETTRADAVITEKDLPHPINPYGASKAAAEAFCHAFYKHTGLSVSICRMQPMYGPRCRPDMLPRRLLEHIHAGRPIAKYGSGEAVRDWLYITDGVAGILAALRTPMGFVIVNLGTGMGTTVNELIRMAEAVVGRPAIIETVGVPSGDAHFGGLADITLARQLLHWEPQVTLKIGLIKTFESMLREHEAAPNIRGRR